MAREKTFNESIRIDAVRRVLDKRGITVEELTRRAPRGFWEQVATELPEAERVGHVVLSNWWTPAKGRISALLSQLSKPEQPEPQAEETAEEQTKSTPQPEPENIPAYLHQWLADMEAKLTTLVKHEVRAAMAEQTLIDTVANVDKVNKSDMVDGVECPLPPKTGKKFEGHKRDIRARMDANLFELFDAEAKRDHGGNLSRMLDVVVWSYFGKPKLSFEE